MDTKFQGIVQSEALAKDGKVELPKSNGGLYQLHRVRLTEGPLKGELILAQRTIKNKDGEDKAKAEVNDEVTVHVRIIQSEGKKPKPFFEIQKSSTLDDESIVDALFKHGLEAQKM